MEAFWLDDAAMYFVDNQSEARDSVYTSWNPVYTCWAVYTSWVMNTAYVPQLRWEILCCLSRRRWHITVVLN